MPDFTTHYLFGQTVVPQLSHRLQSVCRQYFDAFNWGCQGPDLLFYRNPLGGSPLHGLGEQMHSLRTDDFFYEMARYIAQRRGKREYYLLVAYLCGMLCHYYADKTCHPYVFFHEVRLGAGRPRQQWGAIHGQIECDIDIQLYPYYTGLDIADFKPVVHYPLGDALQRSVAALYDHLLRTVYSQEVSQRELYTCFNDMQRYTRLFHDKTGMVRSMALLAENWGKGYAGRYSAHFKHHQVGWDALNLGRRSWHKIGDAAHPRSESIPQLLELAQTEALLALERYYTMVETGRIDQLHYRESFSEGAPLPGAS